MIEIFMEFYGMCVLVNAICYKRIQALLEKRDLVFMLLEAVEFKINTATDAVFGEDLLPGSHSPHLLSQRLKESTQFGGLQGQFSRDLSS